MKFKIKNKKTNSVGEITVECDDAMSRINHEFNMSDNVFMEIFKAGLVNMYRNINGIETIEILDVTKM